MRGADQQLIDDLHTFARPYRALAEHLGIRIFYDLVGLILVDELMKQETA